MNATEQSRNETTLRETIRNMSPRDAQEIRDAYYDAVVGLRRLADRLELVDAHSAYPGQGELMVEHLIACQALRTMKKSLLGRIL